jgi:hypothetical protein
MKLGPLVAITALLWLAGCSSTSVGAPLGSSSTGEAGSEGALNCGDFYGYTSEQSLPACQACLEQSCCSETLACASNSGNECDALDRCEITCPSSNQGCLDQCDQRFPSGVEPNDAWFQCELNYCEQPCIELGDGGEDQ